MINTANVKMTKKGKRLLQVTRRDLDPYFLCSTGDHDIYDCPVCPEFIEHDTYDGAKLYINNTKEIGYCFRCETVFVFEECYNVDFESKEFIKATKVKKDVPDKLYEILSWTKSIRDIPSADHPIGEYFKTGRPHVHSPDILNSYNIRWTTIDDQNIIVFPNDLNNRGETNFFQYKILDDIRKYIAVCPPPILWLETAISLTGKLILVEGVFDAIAIKGAALCGKTLSEKQQLQLREFCLDAEFEEIYLMLDGDVSKENSLKKADDIKNVAGGKKVSIASLPNNMDPEEVVGKGYNPFELLEVID